MSSDRKTLAKYGAKIPSAPKTGAKQQQPAKQDAAADAAAKPEQGAKKTASKKR
jgi:hypothetical protein